LLPSVESIMGFAHAAVLQPLGDAYSF